MKQFENPPESGYNPTMSHSNRKISDTTMMAGVAYLVLIAAGVLGIQTLEPGIPRVIGTLLLVAFGVIFTLSPEDDAPVWRWYLHLTVLTVITAVLLIMQPEWGVFPMLFFILGPTAMMVFPQRIGFLWIGVFTLVTTVIFFIQGPPLEAFLASLIFSAGYWFFGAFARAMASAEEARRESQQLLEELQIAHRQLQEYATRAEELAVAEERNRLAREMHDTLGHRLTVAAVQLEGAQRLITRDPERASSMVGTVREQVREALSELRSAVATLREPLATDLPINIALLRLVNSFDEATDLEVHLKQPDTMPSLASAQRLALYRAVQEALTNVQRHAQAQQVWVDLVVRDDCLSLKISDDGIGFPEDAKEAAFGLRGMRERAAHLGGELRLGSKESGGAWLEFILPLIEETDDDRNDSIAAG
jgi:signal transduction histidine kinase